MISACANDCASTSPRKNKDSRAPRRFRASSQPGRNLFEQRVIHCAGRPRRAADSQQSGSASHLRLSGWPSSKPFLRRCVRPVASYSAAQKKRHASLTACVPSNLLIKDRDLRGLRSRGFTSSLRRAASSCPTCSCTARSRRVEGRPSSRTWFHRSRPCSRCSASLPGSSPDRSSSRASSRQR